MHHTDDLALWPVVRRAGQNFLRRVQQFYVFKDGYSALLLTRDRECYAIGKNYKGCLGVGSNLKEVTQLTEVVELRGVTIVACHTRDGHVMMVTSDEHLWGWGQNDYGQVGCGNRNQHRPVLVMSGVRMVRCGRYHTTALKSDGTLWCWGKNEHGKLGLGHTNEQTTPSQVTGLTGRVVYIDCGVQSCVALTDHPRIYHWGEFTNPISTLTEVSLPSGQITSLTCGYDDFTLLDENGHVHRCYHDNHFKLHCDPIELEEPVHSVTCINYYDNGSYYFKLRSGEVTVWNPERVIRTTLISMADACALYGAHSVTPELTTLPRHVISEPVLRSITQFNDIYTSDFTLHVVCKRIYLNKKIASKLSPYLAAQFQDSWKDKKNVEIRNYSFVVYFTYLRYIFTDTLPVIEPDWAFELLSLAIETQTTELRDHCMQVIQSNGNFSKVITDTNHKRNILDYLTKSLTQDNCCFYYQLAVEAKDDQLQEKIVRFVADRDPSISTLSATERFQQISDRNIKDLLTRCAKLLNKTTSSD